MLSNQHLCAQYDQMFGKNLQSAEHQLAICGSEVGSDSRLIDYPRTKACTGAEGGLPVTHCLLLITARVVFRNNVQCRTPVHAINKKLTNLKQLNINCIKRWVAKGSSKLSQPASIGICCPACSMRGVFSTKRRHYDEHRDTFACSADCPACNSQVHFWLHDLIGDNDGDESQQPTLYMSPASTTQLDLSALPDSVPENVLEFCRSTQDVHQTGNLTATCVLAQSTLDALFTEFLPHGNSQTTLNKLVADAIRSMDLAQPLMKLSSSLHPDGHLQQLLQNRQYASPESVEALLRLIENLITYLFVMPEKFAELDQQFKELNQLTAEAKKTFEAQAITERGKTATPAAVDRMDGNGHNGHNAQQRGAA